MVKIGIFLILLFFGIVYMRLCHFDWLLSSQQLTPFLILSPWLFFAGLILLGAGLQGK